MTKRKVNWLMFLPPVIFVGLGTAFYAGLERENPNELPSTMIGRSAPALAVTPMAGKPELGENPFAGNDVTLVNFWASWCGPCRLEHPMLTSIAEGGVPVVGINYKDQEKNALNFLSELGDPYNAIGRDESGRSGIEWGLYGVPETFVIDGDGKVVLRFPGPITPSVYESRIRPAIEAAQQAN